MGNIAIHQEGQISRWKPRFHRTIKAGQFLLHLLISLEKEKKCKKCKKCKFSEMGQILPRFPKIGNFGSISYTKTLFLQFLFTYLFLSRRKNAILNEKNYGNFSPTLENNNEKNEAGTTVGTRNVARKRSQKPEQVPRYAMKNI